MTTDSLHYVDLAPQLLVAELSVSEVVEMLGDYMKLGLGESILDFAFISRSDIAALKRIPFVEIDKATGKINVHLALIQNVCDALGVDLSQGDLVSRIEFTVQHSKGAGRRSAGDSQLMLQSAHFAKKLIDVTDSLESLTKRLGDVPVIRREETNHAPETCFERLHIVQKVLELERRLIHANLRGIAEMF